MKPILYIANISESDIENPKSNELVKQVEEYAKAEKAQVIPLCIKIEEELAKIKIYGNRTDEDIAGLYK